jgi:hypothetical protein
MRTSAVEEELLVVDEETGRSVPAAGKVLTMDGSIARTGGGSLSAEMQQEVLAAVTWTRLRAAVRADPRVHWTPVS